LVFASLILLNNRWLSWSSRNVLERVIVALTKNSEQIAKYPCTSSPQGIRRMPVTIAPNAAPKENLTKNIQLAELL
jgi:hypothetical protein